VPDIVQINEVLGVASRLREAGEWFLQVLRRLRRQPEDPAPGDWAARSASYARFQNVALAAFLNLQLLASIGMPPKLSGAFWSWPSSVRAWRQTTEALNESLSALFEIALVGDSAVLDAGLAVGEVLGKMASSFPARRGGGDLPPEFVQLVDAGNERLLDYVTAARLDLQKKA
jgi:hypothetical protein